MNKHIFDIEYKIKALRTLYYNISEIDQFPNEIYYNKYYIEEGTQIDVDFRFTIKYEEELRTYLLDERTKTETLNLLKKHISLLTNVIKHNKNCSANRSSSQKLVAVIEYSPYKNNKQTSVYFLKQDNDGKILFYENSNKYILKNKSMGMWIPSNDFHSILLNNINSAYLEMFFDMPIEDTIYSSGICSDKMEQSV